MSFPPHLNRPPMGIPALPPGIPPPQFPGFPPPVPPGKFVGTAAFVVDDSVVLVSGIQESDSVSSIFLCVF